MSILKVLFSLVLLFICSGLNAQVATKYTLSFENASHHETTIEAQFSNLKSSEVEITMSRSSPGRYALHEFVKNVYNLKATNGEGKELELVRIDPYGWKVSDHDGIINLSYTLYANHGDGTYAQVDETHAHLNAPATFMYAPELSNRGVEVTFNVRTDLNWKVATQLKHLKGTTYYAENFQYFMDSPIEISDYRKKSFTVDGQTINFVLHDELATDIDFEEYVLNTQKIVLQQKAVFGQLPTFDYGEYTFLACYMPNVSGDGMEHRNSTVLTSTRSLSHGGKERNIGTVSHEFFHCWNTERIRPKSLEPFNFKEANMSGELWFAEGFTNYYDALTLCRSGVWSHDTYIKDMQRGFNYVWNSPGRQFFNPIEMSYQAPFVDAAKSVDEHNRQNTFISYYNYGEMLGLALDLSLRIHNLNLDEYMKLVWEKFGKENKYYSITDLQQTLSDYAGQEFSNAFFDNYIYKSEMPDFEQLFDNVAIKIEKKEAVSFGAFVREHKLMLNPKTGTMAYDAGFQKNDKIIKIGDFTLSSVVNLDLALSKYNVGEEVEITFERYGKLISKKVLVKTDTNYTLSYNSDANEKKQQRKKEWLQPK